MRRLLVTLCLAWIGVEEVGALAAGSYYSTPGGSSSTCTVTPCPYSSCPVGQYRNGCTFNSSGACAVCTNSPAAGQYISNYGSAAGVCPTLACNNTIPNGQYYSGGGATPGVSTCPTSACTNTLAAGYYYSGAGTTPGVATCPTAACQTCPVGYYNSGCGGTSQGSCLTCGTLPQYKYWQDNVDATSNCPKGDQLNCSAGYYNLGRGDFAPGVCTACSTVTTLPQYSYWTTPSNPDYTCAYLGQTKCSDGYVNSIVASPSSISAGTCSLCTPLTNNGFYYGPNVDPGSNCPKLSCSDSGCAVGQYISNCGTVSPYTSPGTCANCTNAPNSTVVYSSRGGWTGNCAVVGCPTTSCVLGQYVSGCGGLPSALQCKACTNAVAGTSFYVGIGITATCATQNCKICSNGYYTKGCTVLADGTCDVCTN